MFYNCSFYLALLEQTAAARCSLWLHRSSAVCSKLCFAEAARVLNNQKPGKMNLFKCDFLSFRRYNFQKKKKKKLNAEKPENTFNCLNIAYNVF